MREGVRLIGLRWESSAGMGWKGKEKEEREEIGAAAMPVELA